MKRPLTALCTSVLTACLFLGGLTLSKEGFAQNGKGGPIPDACTPVREEIFPLRVPNFETVILWKKVSGIDGADQSIDLISLADGGFVVLGESEAYNKDKNAGLDPKQVYMARVDINGKIIWEKRTGIKGLAGISAGRAVKDRLAVLSEIHQGKRKSVQLDFFDGLGSIKATKSFSDSKYDLVPAGIVSDPSTQMMTLALWAVHPEHADDNFTILKRISSDGKTLKDRQYLPGVPNRLESFDRMKNGDLLGAGSILANGVVSGWILRTDPDGSLVFQRPYARGFQSSFKKITEDGEGNYIAVGDSVPTNEGNRAAWIVKIDRTGNPLWEKFVQGQYAFSARDVAMLPDGRIQVLVNAKPAGSDNGREHIRLLNLTSYGRLIGDEAVVEGANSQATNLLIRDKSRIITGVTQSGLVEYSGATDQKSAGYDFWILGLPKLGAYKDACSSGRTRSFSDGF